MITLSTDKAALPNRRPRPMGPRKGCQWPTPMSLLSRGVPWQDDTVLKYSSSLAGGLKVFSRATFV